MRAAAILIPGIALFCAFRSFAQGVRPTPPPVAYTNSVDFNFPSNVFRFLYNGSDGSLEYEYAPGLNGSFFPLRCKINGQYIERPANYGGLAIATSGPEIDPWQPGVSFQLMDVYATNANALFARWRMSSGSNNLTYTYQFQLVARTLSIHVATTNAAVSSLYLDRCEDATNPIIVHVPYLAMMNVLYSGGFFTSMFFDWENTSASTIYPADSVFSATSVYYAQNAQYLPLTDGSRRKVDETVYLTISSSLTDVLPAIPNPVSPYKSPVSKYLVFDFWQTPFSFSRSNLLALVSAGVTNIWFVQHAWQNSGYDNRYPDVLPANPAWGGDMELQKLSQTARTNGCLFALHENYTDFYTNAPSWTPSAVARNSDGSPKTAWFNPSTGMQSYELKPAFASNYSSIFSPLIHSNYTTTATFLDVHSAVNPSDKVDCDLSNVAGFRDVLGDYRNLAAELRAFHHGPVSGEGYRHMQFVGYFDDIEAQIDTGSYQPRTHGAFLPVLVDFELLRLHPKTLTHGVGYYERFYADASFNSQFLTFSRDQVLEYIATELIYGHGGFIPTPDRVYDVVDVARLEQRHVLPVQRAYADAMPIGILYHDAASNDLLSASAYILRYPAVFDKSTNANYMSQVMVAYDNGVIVCANRHPTSPWTFSLGHAGGWFDFNATFNGTNVQWTGVTNLTSYTLPPSNGWVVFVPDPTAPKFASVNLTNGVLSLEITNLLPGYSNTLEESLSFTNWQTLKTFVSTSAQATISQGVSNPDNGFFRLNRSAR